MDNSDIFLPIGTKTTFKPIGAETTFKPIGAILPQLPSQRNDQDGVFRILIIRTLHREAISKYVKELLILGINKC